MIDEYHPHVRILHWEFEERDVGTEQVFYTVAIDQCLHKYSLISGCFCNESTTSESLRAKKRPLPCKSGLALPKAEVLLSIQLRSCSLSDSKVSMIMALDVRHTG